MVAEQSTRYRIHNRVDRPLALLVGLILAVVALGGTPASASCTDDWSREVQGAQLVPDSHSEIGSAYELNEGSNLTIRIYGHTCHPSNFDWMISLGAGLRFSDATALSYSRQGTPYESYGHGRGTFDYTFRVTATEDGDEDDELVTGVILVNGI